MACDVATLAELERIVVATHDLEYIAGYKVGFGLGLSLGLKTATTAIHTFTKKPVIYDHQKAATDIPHTGELFARVCADADLAGAILFPLSGPRTETTWIQALQQQSVEPIVGATMTHPQFLAAEGGFISDDAPDRIYSLALQEGVTHLVLPGTRLDLIASDLLDAHRSLRYLIPGIGTQGGSIEALASKLPIASCLPIVGSAIYRAADPRSAAMSFAEQYGEALWVS